MILSGREQGKWELREAVGNIPVQKFAPENENFYEMHLPNAPDKKGTFIIESDTTVEQFVCLMDLKETFPTPHYF